MRCATLAVSLLAVSALSSRATAQRPLALELGVFGQHTRLDEELELDNPPGLGARLAIFALLRNLSIEGDIQVGSTNWNIASGPRSVTYRPAAVRLVYGIPLSERAQLLLGGGYQLNVFAGRTQTIGQAVAGNEYEDALTGLAGLKFCLGEQWSLRFDVPIDYNPSPNFNGSTITLDGKSTNVGLRLGLGRMLKGTCFDRSEPLPPPPPAAPPPPQPAPTPAPTPPAPPPNQPPVATIIAPVNGASFRGPTTFTGSCSDPEQGDVGASARWSSNRDGSIGTGRSFNRTLTPGTHTITLTCSDPQGLTGTATVNVTAQELLVQLNWVYFDFDRATLTQAGRDTLNQLMVTLRNRPDMMIAVEGHTDPYGSDAYNQSLSERRAQAVVDFLTRGGIAANRIASKGFGEQCLLLEDDHTTPSRSRAEHRANRRVEVWSVGNGGVSAGCRPRQ